MALITSQQLARYYESYKDVEVTFNASVNKAIGLLPKQVHLKCAGDQWPCVPYSASLQAARVISQIGTGELATLKNANNAVALRLAFRPPDDTKPSMFFVSSRVAGISRYDEDNRHLHFLNLEFTQKLPNDYIQIIGQLLEATANSQKRKDERIIITEESARGLGLASRDATVHVDFVPRKCLLRDLSFSGAKVIIVGLAKFLQEKPVVLSVKFNDLPQPLPLKGRVLRLEQVEGRRELVAAALCYDEESLPIQYKLRINEYLTRKQTANEPD